MTVYNLEDNRALCWDDFFMEKQTDVIVKMHQPEKKEVAVLCDEEWEGIHNGYASVIKEGDRYEFRYRASTTALTEEKMEYRPMVYCLMQSIDGKQFRRVYVDKYKYNGSSHNNIFHKEDRVLDNFSIFLDENPNCKKEEKYKALSLYHTESDPELALYFSENGIDFIYSRALPLGGG